MTIPKHDAQMTCGGLHCYSVGNIMAGDFFNNDLRKITHIIPQEGHEDPDFGTIYMTNLTPGEIEAHNTRMAARQAEYERTGK